MPPARRRVPAAPGALLRAALAWPTESQLRARRNALLASTELAARRKEREEVEDFLAGREDGNAARSAHSG